LSLVSCRHGIRGAGTAVGRAGGRGRGHAEEVWEAIATGPGISAWLQPTEVEERQGGRFSFDMGAGPQTVTAWEPPRRFAQEVSWEPGGDLAPARLATEWLVEARGDGTCLVRMVMSGFGADAGWEDELEGMAAGMRAALAILACHRRWFPGALAAWLRVSAAAPGPEAATWAELAGALGLAGATASRRVDGPGGPLGLQVRLHGDDRAEVAAREQPAWAARFPADRGPERP
jgi:uncharacterized protein YndB with AHSA1/START domain